MKIKYYLINPTGNITIIADAPVEPALQPEIAKRLMQLEPTAEQVGFLNGSSLRMAGGEFCGNASMSAAALICRNRGKNSGDISLSVSGAEDEICVSITENDGSFVGTVTMPKAEAIESKEFEFNGKTYSLPTVKFSGITHIISKNVLDRTTAETAVRKWCSDLGCDCIGIMLLDIESNRLDPLVYVRTAGTLFWESSCASGTSAVGAYVAKQRNKPVELSLTEPGGVLRVYADKNCIKLSGSVEILKENTVEI